MKHCQHCNKEFPPSRCTQKYCRNRECQKSRKREWQKTKMQTDPDYKANQREAQKRWSTQNRDYWKAYRASHPAYTARNRQLQQKRNSHRTTVSVQAGDESIAKMDAKVPELSGTYYIWPVTSCIEFPELIAKMDAKLVTIQSVIEMGVKKM